MCSHSHLPRLFRHNTVAHGLTTLERARLERDFLALECATDPRPYGDVAHIGWAQRETRRQQAERRWKWEGYLP
jgi:hypothetical protein